MESEKFLRFNTNNNNTKPIMPTNDLSQKQPPSLLDRFRVLLKQKEAEARVSADDDDDVAGGPSDGEIVHLYELVLDELIFNSKPIITDLTIIAGELREHGAGIADSICARIVEVPVDQKLPSLYLLDSIVKNIGRDYVRHFSSRLPEVFCEAYSQVHPSQHPSLRHLFRTWSTVFPPSVLGKIENQLQFSSQVGSNQSSGLSSLKASDSPRTTNVIHVNPKYVRMEPSPSENNSQHVRGASTILKSFSQKPSIGYDENDSDHVEVAPSQLGAQRLNTMGNFGPSSFGIGTHKLHPSSSSRLTKRLSPSRIGAERPLPSQHDDFTTGNSARTFVDGASPSHSVIDYGPLRPIGRDEETTEWRRKHFSEENSNRFEASTVYSLSNGHEHKGPRALIDAYGEDKRNRITSSKPLQIERLDVDGKSNKVGPRSWQNTEEEEFDWEDMSPTLIDRSRSNDLLLSVPPFRGAGARPGFGKRTASQLDSAIRSNWPSQAQVPLADDSSNVADDSISIIGPGRGGTMPAFQTDRNQIMGSHYPREVLKLPHHFPQSTDLMNAKGRGRDFQMPFSGSGISSLGSEILGPPVDKLPDNDAHIGNHPTLPSRMGSTAAPSLTGVWPLPNMHKSHPLPLHPIFSSQTQSRSQLDPRNASNNQLSQGLQKSSFLSEQQFNGLESKEHSFIKQPLLPGQHAALNQLHQAQLNHFRPQFLLSNEVRENFPPSLAPVPPHPMARPFDHRYVPQGAAISMGASNLGPPMQLHLPANITNTMHLQVGVRPPLPPGRPPTSHMIPIPQSAGAGVSNQPAGGAFSGLINSLMAQGLISMNQAPVQDSVGLEFDADLLKVRHETSISALYADLPRQCTTCGLRFKCQEEHSSHMDWHVTKNRMSKNRKQKASRKWFVCASMWLSGAEALGIDAVPGFLPTEAVLEKKDDEEMAVPADEEQNACALCGEPFDDFYSDETEEWMYKGAVYLNAIDGSAVGMDRSQLGPIVHAKCRSESSTVPPDDSRSDEVANDEEASHRKRMRS
ncbi:polyadenylation and cleavage factor homolog 4 [Mercurialis annua]|uniref:polyadenylation and cleavage factor homolog 4 n=1 Tax=Mercurialis annua TaxID=3986 RepID=UPI00215E98DE|nr:polyadenylation and cleavage factor homolog 4 [Mercurialis annua]